MRPLVEFSIPDLERFLREQCIPTVHARKLLRRFFDTGGGGIDGTGLPRRLCELIGGEIPLRTSSLLARQLARDGTLKLLIGLANRPGPRGDVDPARGASDAVECVLMPSHRPDRTAGCISSQVGCAMGCDFCASTKSGLQRNLSPGEIVEQFLHLRRASLDMGRRLVTVVFMGMGEPLLNYDNVVEAIHRIAGHELGALGWRQVTVSTVGIVPAMRRLAEEKLGVQLALSLHAPDDATRCAIVPSGKKYRVAEILDAASFYHDATGRIVNIEYCLLEGVNDCDGQAALLGRLLAGRRMHVNLIPYNPTGPGVSGRVYRSPSVQRMRRFAQILGEHYIVAHFRQVRGQEIDGACGQLKNRIDAAR